MPEGFKELQAYLESRKGEKVKAEEIQKNLQLTYGFTSGKVTGILKRAEEQKFVVKVSRGMYMLNTGETNIEESFKPVDIYKLVNNEIVNCIGKIQSIIGDNFSTLNTSDVEKLQKKIRKLKEITVEE
ncbi:hypothetical protein [Clostridium botulinum]|uniref:hypothetical protein n=1 Tax=Clostridium botulinum TaxID=1491 RepID=UPI0013FF847A|nr:hypothetical protein [Clostridium botulinum]MBN1050440.1 hypothetical protein [Clostridium botulinum]NFI54735.1 hypothetical protein [Clostridium botulinum]